VQARGRLGSARCVPKELDKALAASFGRALHLTSKAQGGRAAPCERERYRLALARDLREQPQAPRWRACETHSIACRVTANTPTVGLERTKLLARIHTNSRRSTSARPAGGATTCSRRHWRAGAAGLPTANTPTVGLEQRKLRARIHTNSRRSTSARPAGGATTCSRRALAQLQVLPASRRGSSLLWLAEAEDARTSSALGCLVPFQHARANQLCGHGAPVSGFRKRTGDCAACCRGGARERRDKGAAACSARWLARQGREA
jgi:hypothetical protein